MNTHLHEYLHHPAPVLRQLRFVSFLSSLGFSSLLLLRVFVVSPTVSPFQWIFLLKPGDCKVDTEFAFATS